MNLLIHQFKKDVYHLRWLLLAWIAFLFVDLGLTSWCLSFQKPGSLFELSLQASRIILPLLKFLLLFVSVPLLLHEEPLVGTTGFWMTRPIPRGILLVSKGLFLLLFFVLLPMGLTALLFLKNQVSPHYTLLAVEEVFMKQMMAAFFLAALASITKNFARYALWVVALFAAKWVIVCSLGAGTFYLAAKSPDPDTALKFLKDSMFSPSLTTSKVLVSAIFVTLAGVIVLMWQLFVRRTRAAIVILLSAFVAAILLSFYWRIDFFAIKESPRDFSGLKIELPQRSSHVVDRNTPSAGPSGVNINIQIGKPAHENLPNAYKTLYGPVTVSGLSPDVFAVPGDMHATLKTPAGEENYHSPNPLITFPSNAINAKALSASLGGVPVYYDLTLQPSYDVVLKEVLSSKNYEASKNVPLTLEATITSDLYAYAPEYQLPLKVGEIYQTGASRVSIQKIRADSGTINITLYKMDTNLLFAPKKENPFTRLIERSIPSAIYVLVNRKKNEAVVCVANASSDFNPFQVGQMLYTNNINLTFNTPGAKGNAPVTLNDEWLQDATLRVLRMDQFEEVKTKSVRTDFLVNPPNES